MNARQFPQSTIKSSTSNKHYYHVGGPASGKGSVVVEGDSLEISLSSGARYGLTNYPLNYAEPVAAALFLARADVKAIKDAEAKQAEEARVKAAKKDASERVRALTGVFHTDNCAEVNVMTFDESDSTVRIDIDAYWFDVNALNQTIERLVSLRDALAEHKKLHDN